MTDSLDYYFLIRFAINIIGVLVLVRFIYFRIHRHRIYASSFILFGAGVFLVTGQLAAVEISMGFAFGLFAIFSMLRYRTEAITIMEMTYLFLVIAMSLLSAVSGLSHIELALVLGIICLLAQLTETNLLLPRLEEHTVEYEKIENIVPDRKAELIQDLRERLGQDIRSVEIIYVDFLKDTARLKLQFVAPENDG